MNTFYRKLFLVLILVTSHALVAQEKVSKKIEESYPITPSGELHIENKYGNIVVAGWEKNMVGISINIRVSHKKRENAEKLLNRIDVDVKTSRDFVSIRSEIAERSTSVFSRYFNKVNPFDIDKSNVQIDYTVFLPVNAEMDIINKFGDVVIGDWKGKLRAQVEHGDIWINNDLNNADIELKFGKLKAKILNSANLRLKNGDIDMEGGQNIRLNSSGSNIEIDNISSLEIYSNKDDIAIKSVDNIKGDLKFSKMHLTVLEQSMSLTMKVTDMLVSKVNTPDVTISIDEESSELDINITNTSFLLETTLEQGVLRLPTSFSDIKTSMLDKSKKLRRINASYGKNPVGQITITGQKGTIIFREQ